MTTLLRYHSYPLWYQLYTFLPTFKQHTFSVKADQTKFVPCVTNARESKELIVAIDTSDPGCLLGQHLYKGFLENGQEVALKRFDGQADLWAEVRMLRRVEHSNLVKMIAYNEKGKDCVVVYEYMPLQSLNLHLQDLKPGKKPLDWKTRMKIAEGVAKALEYLHDQKDPPVIYGGLSRTCILLDESYNPKLSDFSCAKDGPLGDYTSMFFKMMETNGYIAPEFFMTGHLTSKSDVFSFGVVLLELISGEKVIEDNIRDSGKHTITAWARPLLDNEKFQDIADPLMKGQYPYAGLVKALYLAKMCVKDEAHERRPIAEVVLTLSKINSQIYEQPQVTTVTDPFTPPTILCSAQAVALVKSCGERSSKVMEQFCKTVYG
ncbi:hypothetical protein MKW94_026162 [Papaver nudicaule]|uniref:Protein kinase domain-containing protein n=1 Tax=Papaver nudicaule TaxID=74823 RepID=A0AA41RL42_PAPNU|nr:hypothetical protein [Papaver nudicaule]